MHVVLSGEVLALLAALCYGLTHFFNGLLARRAGGVAIAFFAQAGGTLVILALALLFREGQPTMPALGWGALSGVGAGLGMAFLYRGLSRGRMSVVVPVSDVGAAVIPVLAGIVLLDERPPVLALCGIAVAFPAIWMVSRSTQADDWQGRNAGRDGGGDAVQNTRERAGAAGPGTPRRPRSAVGALDGVLAGAGVALTWLALSQVPAGTGLWPLVVSRVVSVIAVLPMVFGTRTSLRVPATRIAIPSAVVGAVGSVATLLFMLATREQLVALASVLSALYPVIPVVLALVFLRERITRTQATGLAGAAAAIALIALH